MAQIKKISTELQLLDKFLDTSGDAGTSGQILSSTATGINWINGSAIPGVPGGSGTVNTIPLWTPNGDTLGNSVMTQSGVNIGIGTTTYTNSSGYSTLNINGTTSGGGGQIAFQTSGSSKHFIWGNATDFNIYNGQTGPLIFYTGATERMRINASGNVGIGTTNPTESMLVISAGATGTTGGGQAGITMINKFDNPDNSWSILPVITGVANTGLSIRDNTDSADRLVIDGSGNVGIGTTTMNQFVNITSDSNTTTLMQLRTADGSEVMNFGIGSDIGYLYMESNTDMTFGTNGGEKMRITSSGNDGIGTTSPNASLTVVDNSDGSSTPLVVASGDGAFDVNQEVRMSF